MKNSSFQKLWACLTIAAVLVATMPRRSEAQSLEGAIIGGGGVVVSKILDRLTNKIDRLIAKAIEGADFIVEKSASELNLAIENLAIVLGEERDTTFDRLSTEHQKLLSTINRLVDELEHSPRRIMELEDFIALDLHNLSRSIFVILGEEPPYTLRRIDGYSQIYRESGSYQVSVIGDAFGPGFDCEAMINGVEVSDLDKSFPRLYKFEFSVPVGRLNEHFSDDNVNRIPFVVQTKKDGKVVFRHEGKLLLLPKRPVSFSLIEHQAKAGWSKELYWTAEKPFQVNKKTTRSITLSVPHGCKLKSKAPIVTRTDMDEYIDELWEKLKKRRKWAEKFTYKIKWDAEGQLITKSGPAGGGYVYDYNKLARKMYGLGLFGKHHYSGNGTQVSRQFKNTLRDTRVYAKTQYHKPVIKVVESRVRFGQHDDRLPFGAAFARFSDEYQSFTLKLKWFNGETSILSPTNESDGPARATLESKTNFYRLRVDVKWPSA